MIEIKKSSLVIVLVASFLLAFCNAVFAQERKEIKPKKFVSLVHMTSDSDFVYYALSEKTKTSITVTGPGKLIVFNRVRLEDNQKASRPYYLKYIIDGKRIISQKIGPQEMSKKVSYKSNLPGTPSKVDKEVINIPPGKHQLNFYKYKTKQKAHVRFVFQPTKKLFWKELKSISNLNRVKIEHQKNKKQQTYYRIDNKSGFKFRNDSSQKLRIFLRADFNYKMHDENVIRFALKKNGEVIKTYKVTCKKSAAVQNITDKALMPGALEKVFIDIPSQDKNQYEIVLKNSDKSAIIRVFLGNKKQEKKINAA
ncbi:hypothetical protein [Seonamhaeicola sp.]|uniref:hypothetical protein n=1 Tax=Seonamhaeicola sp. TaxID=1912245 RepID=UPI002608D30C|nr:hypothetical protein [Seonamhaeicola sp.]